MARPTESATFRWLSLVLLVGMACAKPATVLGQEGALLPPLTVLVGAVPPAGDSQQLSERLGKMEQRLDWLTNQNEDLLRENRVLTEKLEAPSSTSTMPPHRPSATLSAFGANAIE